MATKESKNLESKTPTSKVVLDVSGYMSSLTPINRRYHLTQVVDSNLPSASPIVLTSIKDTILAELNSKKHLEACKVVLTSVNESGKDIVIKVFKNLWYSEDGKVVNIPSLMVDEAVDYLKEYTINRKALIEYVSNPTDYSTLLTKVYKVVDIIKSEGKGSKRRITSQEKV